MQIMYFHISILLIFTSLICYSQEFQLDNGDEGIFDERVSFTDRGKRGYAEYINLDLNIPGTETYFSPNFGTILHERTDLCINDISFPVRIAFTYNSLSSAQTRFGKNWQMNYNFRYTTNNKNGNIIIVYPDGKTELFLWNAGEFQSTYGCNDKLVATGNGLKLIMYHDVFNNKGDYSEYLFESPIHNYVTKIIDKNGLEIIIVYEDKKLSRVDWPSGRKADFVYDNNFLESIKYADWEINFEYDESGNLISSDNNFEGQIKYSYDECSLLKSITTSATGYFFEYGDDYSFRKVSGPDNIAILDAFYNNEDKTCRVDIFGESYLNIEWDELFRTRVIIKDGNRAEYRWDDSFNLIQFKGFEGREYSYEYDENGFPVAERNPSGNITKYKYDNTGRLKFIQSPENNTTEYEYDENGNLHRVKYNNNEIAGFEVELTGLLSKFIVSGNEYYYSFDEFGNIVKIDAPLRSLHFTYNEFGNTVSFKNSDNPEYFLSYVNNKISSIIYQNGFRKSYHYSGGLLTGIKSRNSWEISYDKYANPTEILLNEQIFAEINNEHTRITNITHSGRDYKFDYSSDELREYTNPYGGKFLLEYTPSGKAGKVDLNGNTIKSYIYNKNGETAEVLHGNSASENFIYNRDGKVVEYIDLRDNSYTFKYNDLGNFYSIVDPYGNELKYEKNLHAKISLLTDRNRVENTQYYNENHQISDLAGPLTGAHKLLYFNNGKLNGINFPGTKQEEYEYDEFGNLVKRVNNVNEEIYSWDNNGNLISYINIFGSVFSFNYDTNNLLNSIYGPEGFLTEVKYNQRFNPISIKQHNDLLKFNYSPEGFLSSLIFNSDTNYFGYNDVGMFNEFRNRFGNNIRLLYGESGNILNIIGPLNTGINIEYDNQTVPISINDESGNSVILLYDKQNRLKELRQPGRNEIIYSYDNNGNLAKEFRANEVYSEYIYNQSSDLETIKDANGNSLNLKYNSSGIFDGFSSYEGKDFTFNKGAGNKLSSIVNGNSTNIKYYYSGDLINKVIDETENQILFAYDSLARLISINNGEVITSIDYEGNNISTIDLSGFRIDIDNTGRKSNYSSGNIQGIQIEGNFPYIDSYKSNGLEIDFDYDDAGRLRQLGYPENKSVLFNYYDNSLISDIKLKNNATRKFQYDDSGMLTELYFRQNESIYYLYDLNGNMIQKKLENGNSYYFSYDKTDKMVRINSSPGRGSGFEYDKDGRLISTTSERSHSLDFFYDERGLLRNIADGMNNDILINYNPAGNILDFYQKNKDQISIEYDNQYLPKSIKSEINGKISLSFDGFFLKEIKDNTGSILASFNYNEGLLSNYNDCCSALNFKQLPDKLEITHANGLEYSILFDANGFPVSYIFNGNTTSLSRSEELVTSITSNEGDNYAYSYNNRSRVRTIQTPSANNYSYNFDPLGNLIWRFDPGIGEFTYMHNFNSRLSSVFYPEQDDFLQLSYYQGGGLFEASQSFGLRHSVIYYRNKAGNIDSLRFLYDNILNSKFIFRQLNGFKQSISGPVNSEIAFNQAFLTGEITVNDGSFKFSYPGEGFADIDFPDDLELKRENSLTGYNYYILSRTGDTIRIIRQVLSKCLTDSIINGQIVFNSDYDNLGRLSSYVYDENSVSYQYDNFGNITSRTVDGNSTSFEYSPENRLILADNDTISYDMNGNLVSIKKENTVYEYRYNYNNQLVEALKNDTIICRLDYSFDGKLVFIKDNSGYHYLTYSEASMNTDNAKPTGYWVTVFDSTATPVESYLFNPDIDNYLNPLCSYNHDESQNRYYVNLPFGFSFQIDENGEITDSLIAGHYLNEILKSDGYSGLFRFGKLFIEEAGLYYDGNRMYHPQYHIFMQQADVIADESLNLYKFKLPKKFHCNVNLPVLPQVKLELPFFPITRIPELLDFKYRQKEIQSEILLQDINSVFNSDYFGAKPIVRFNSNFISNSQFGKEFQDFYDEIEDIEKLTSTEILSDFENIPKISFIPKLPEIQFAGMIFNQEFEYSLEDFLFEKYSTEFTTPHFTLTKTDCGYKIYNKELLLINAIQPEIPKPKRVMINPFGDKIIPQKKLGIIDLHPQTGIGDLYRMNYPGFENNSIIPEPAYYHSPQLSTKLKSIMDILEICSGNFPDRLERDILGKSNIPNEEVIIWEPGISEDNFLNGYESKFNNVNIFNNLNIREYIERIFKLMPENATPGLTNYRPVEIIDKIISETEYFPPQKIKSRKKPAINLFNTR